SRRQREILFHVVREYVATGQPVGSKHLVQHARLPVSPSTVRNELAEVEARGDVRGGAFPLDLSELRREVDAALQATTEMLSSVTRLLALVSAPSLETTTVRHVEVLLLQ